MQKVSFIIPSRDNLKYLQLAYNSIRKNMPNEHEICIADDNSKDDTGEGLKKQKENDNNLKIYRNTSGKRYGLTILYDYLINELATNDIVIACHTDMYYGKNFVKNLLKHHGDKRVVCATRIEPPLHPQGPEKIIKDFGIKVNDFKENKFHSFIKEKQKEIEGHTTNGFFAPGLISKKDFNDIGGHDPLFKPQSREDSDLAYRLYLNDNDLIQSRDSFVYHFTCRGSRYKDEIGKDSMEWQKTNYKAERNFVRKGGSMVETTETLLPIINNKYQIRLILDCRDKLDRISFSELLRIAEPYIQSMIIHDPNNLYEQTVNKYIQDESKLTDYNLKEKILYNYKDNIERMDVEIFSQPELLSKDNGKFIQLIHRLLDKVEEPGQYDFDGNKLVIKELNGSYYMDNVYSDDSYKNYMKE